MTSTLHDAITAVRAGETERAQLLAADIVRNNPDDANAWYLLSQLVDSDARRAAYLGKTLALDPAHPRARAEFAALPPGLVSEPAMPLVVAAAAGEELVVTDAITHEAPPAVEAADELVVMAEAAAQEALAGEPALPSPAVEVPEWLQPLGPQPVAATTGPRPRTSAPTPQPRKTTAPRKNSGNQALTLMLGLLAFLTIVVLAFLVYLLFF